MASKTSTHANIKFEKKNNKNIYLNVKKIMEYIHIYTYIIYKCICIAQLHFIANGFGKLQSILLLLHITIVICAICAWSCMSHHSKLHTAPYL